MRGSRRSARRSLRRSGAAPVPALGRSGCRGWHAGRRCSARTRRGDTARTEKFIAECFSPHSSAQRPTYSPSLLIVTSKVLARPGMTSRLNRNAGTQNEWMTSGEVSVKRIVVSVGSTSHRRLTGDARDRDAVVGVVEGPVPLEADDADVDLGAALVLGRQLVDEVLRDRRVVEEHRDDHERDDGVEHLDRQVVADLAGQLRRSSSAVAHHREQDQARDADSRRRRPRRRSRARARRCSSACSVTGLGKPSEKLSSYSSRPPLQPVGQQARQAAARARGGTRRRRTGEGVWLNLSGLPDKRT